MSCVTKTTGVPALLPARVEQVDDAALVGEVEREERLVGEQQRRVGDERLRDAQPLLLAARETADRRVGVRASRRPRRARASTRARSSAPKRPKPQRWPSSPSRTRSRPRSGDVAVEDALLRDVADRDGSARAAGSPRSRRCRRSARAARAGSGSATSCPCRSGRARRAARPARARSSSPSKSVALAEAERRDPSTRDDAHLVASAAASARAWSSCHCWKVRCGGSVSVTGRPGCPPPRRVRSRAVMGETAWLL